MREGERKSRWVREKGKKKEGKVEKKGKKTN